MSDPFVDELRTFFLSYAKHQPDCPGANPNAWSDQRRVCVCGFAPRLDELLRKLDDRLSRFPDQPDFAVARDKLAAALNERGLADFRGKRFAEAVAGYREALELRPDFHEARNNLGCALAAAGQHAEAIACFRAVIEASPRDAGAHNSLGTSLHAQGRPEAARRAFEAALAIEPAHADALINLGFLAQEEGRFSEAITMCRRALAAEPQSATARYDLGFALVCTFDFAEGWELMEWRYRTTPPMVTPRSFAKPEFAEADWGGGHRTAIWGEQGVGDRLVYATLLPEIAARGEAFILETDSRLVAAFARSHPDWKVVTRDRSEAEFAACDRGIPNASLPKLMRRTLADFDRQPRSLLAADRSRAADFRSRLAQPGVRVVGISWRSFQSAGRSVVQRRKSATLAHFDALSRREDLRLLDLQYGDTAAEREAFARAGGPLTRLEDLDLFNDIDGVLAAVEACDLIVTTSNVTAHFAGALGKRVLLVYLAAVPPFHYWATDGSGRCLWYPSMEIVTGRDLDTWDKVLAVAAERL